MSDHQYELPGMAVTTKATTGINDIASDKSGRARRMFKFWLDVVKPHELEMAIVIEEMRVSKKRQWQPFIKNAIRLLLSLLAGKDDVLHELFPDLIKGIQSEATLHYEKTISGMDIEGDALRNIVGKQEDEIARLRSENDRLQSAQAAIDFEAMIRNAVKQGMDTLIESISIGGESPSTPQSTVMQSSHSDTRLTGLKPLNQATASPKQLAAPQFAAPDFSEDDTELVITIDEQSGKRASDNFIRSLMNLVDHKPDTASKPVQSRKRGS